MNEIRVIIIRVPTVRARIRRAIRTDQIIIVSPWNSDKKTNTGSPQNEKSDEQQS